MKQISLIVLLLVTVGFSVGCGSSEPQVGPEVETTVDEGLTQEIEAAGITTAEEYLKQGSLPQDSTENQ